MKLLGTKKVRIASLVLPGDWRARLSSDRVRDLARSIEEGTPILQRTSVRKSDGAIGWGRDRLAAMHVLGHETVEVDQWEATDVEWQRAVIIENLHRRHDNKDALKASLVETFAETIVGRSDQQLPTAAKPGRKKAARTIAREQAAEAIGTTPEAIRSAEQREKARQAELTPEPVETALPPWTDVAEALESIDHHLKMAKTLVTKLMGAHPELVERFGVHQARTALAEATLHLRGMRPHGACPYGAYPAGSWAAGVALTAHYDCPACKGSGWITADQAAQAPKDLTSPPATLPAGLTSAPAAGAKPALSKPRKGKKLDVRIKDESGNERTWGDDEGAF